MSRVGEMLCLLRVKPGNAHNEPRLSAFRPVAIAKGEVEFGCQVVIQAPKRVRIMRCEHTSMMGRHQAVPAE